MEVEPILELPPHQERRRRRRSSFYDEKMEEMELMLLKLGVRPEWLQVHRIINSKYVLILPSNYNNRYCNRYCIAFLL